MNRVIRFMLVLCTCGGVFFISGKDEDKLLCYRHGNFLLDFSFNHKPEMFYTKNIAYFSGSDLDKTIYAQGTWDFSLNASFQDVLKSNMTLRNRSRWGTTKGIAVTKNKIKILDAELDDHDHTLNRLLFWMREGWLELSLNDTFDVGTQARHYLKLGAFPFQLGRGISLGSAYAVAPGIIGFFAENTIDAFAFGALFHGDVVKDKLHYDLYGEIADNMSESFDSNAETIKTQSMTAPCKYRGFGDIKFITAGRLIWTLFDKPVWGALSLEPYAMYCRAPVQRAEFLGDANLKLGTLGLAMEYVSTRWELGWEVATNLGRQAIDAWDRNVIDLRRNPDTGNVQEIYKYVYEDVALTNNAPVTNTNKDIVDNKSIKTPLQNGQKIDASHLYNGRYRFHNAYVNKLNGFMLVLDGTYWLKPEELRGSLAFAYASGDENPNVPLDDPYEAERDGTYSGFIGLQEVYSGKRVRSMFVIGSQRIARPLSAPSLAVVQERQAQTASISGFTNLICMGGGLRWTPQRYERKFELAPNLIYYWQEKASRKFDKTQPTYDKQSLTCPASKALGMELNVFLDVYWVEHLKSYLAAGVFVPGQHFRDIEGKPVNKDQYKEVVKGNYSRNDVNAYPLLGYRPAFAINAGFEYIF